MAPLVVPLAPLSLLFITLSHWKKLQLLSVPLAACILHTISCLITGTKLLSVLLCLCPDWSTPSQGLFWSGRASVFLDLWHRAGIWKCNCNGNCSNWLEKRRKSHLLRFVANFNIIFGNLITCPSPFRIVSGGQSEFCLFDASELLMSLLQLLCSVAAAVAPSASPFHSHYIFISFSFSFPCLQIFTLASSSGFDCL